MKFSRKAQLNTMVKIAIVVYPWHCPRSRGVAMFTKKRCSAGCKDSFMVSLEPNLTRLPSLYWGLKSHKRQSIKYLLFSENICKASKLTWAIC